MNLNDFLTWLKKLIEELAPALAVLFWNYEEAKISKAKHEAMDAQLKFELEKNHETVDEKYAGKSDIDVVNDAIASGAGQSGPSDQGSQPGSSTSRDSKK